ncbi:amino acid adenylation domain-containing protein [Rhizobium sp. SSA_523]|uniref:amino acid adenylation domain-containing protein n=1 Tax=Rhizobium sp. SSA_523 TaxID=2952477 RepID=UPI002091434E|nr:amino acid adenylation domain-containing protein [Rhizobium sp. SSA_523]MCO5732804.1 amino acid adenylation domain-containing protein [Rhizobium sp. SSA_523]WKC23578.1 amino acid adenylation domain-containing protein [Rhizobium sp. SSA_523]
MTVPPPLKASSDRLARRLPLTEAQKGIWFAQSIDPSNPVFNTGHYVEIEGRLDVPALENAVRRVAMEAVSLSVHIPDKCEQVVEERNRPLLRMEDLSGQDDPHSAALAAIQADMRTPVDMAEGPLARQVLYRLGADRFLWYQRMHHVITDGFATGLVTQRIAELYNAAVAHEPTGAPLADLDVAVGEKGGCKWRERDAAYWRDALQCLPEAMGLKPGTARSGPSYDHSERELPGEVCDKLLQLSLAEKLSWPDIVTALAGAYVARHLRRDEVVIGVPFMGRFGSSAARVPTILMNILPLRLTVDEDVALVDWLRQASGRMARDRRHGPYRAEQMRRDLGLLGGQKRLYGPLVNILPFDAPPRLAGLKTKLVILGTGPVDDITFSVRGDFAARRLKLEVDANTSLYDAGEVEGHAERLAAFLGAAVEAALAGGPLRNVESVTREERFWLTESLNDTAHPVTQKSLTQLLEDSFASFSDRQALRFGGHSLTYAELDCRTAALAEWLARRGAGRDAIVAVTLPRSIELVVALIAILRAGAGYMPLDLNHPKERLERILASSRPRVVLGVDEDFRLAGSADVFPPSAWPAEPLGETLPETAGDSAAYVIYTSGSTGEPKGVVVEHTAIVNRLEWMRQHYGFGPDDVILQKTPMTFDVSVWEFFLSFLSGGCLVVAPPDAHKDPRTIAKLIRDEGITTVHFVPSMLSAFLAEPETRGLSIKRVFCSGEELTADLRNRFHERVTAALHNLYGPTEAAVDVTFWPAGADDHARPVPIGHPVWNTRLYILDERMRLVPTGVEGQLYLAGVQLAREYLGQPALTAERFVANPFKPGERMYRTGDLARVRSDGAIVYLGRSDHQIKLRGLRIELGEIETAILAHPAVTQTVVIVQQDSAGERRLVAYVTLEEGRTQQGLVADILAQAGKILPDYMLPAAIVILDALPVNANGKLDRKLLPAPVFAGGRGRNPATEHEKLVAMLFERVLKAHGPLQVEDDFFDLGGHSLLAVELMLHLREITGHEPGIGVLFEHSTIGRLALYLDRHLDYGPAGAWAGLQPMIKLSAAEGDKSPVFMLHPAGGLSWCYNGLARALGADRPAWGVQALALDPHAEAPQSLDDMALDYARRIGFIARQTTIHLLGWSVGGILAQTVAVHLEERGHAVGLVALLDAYPCDCWRHEPDPGPGAALKALLAIGGHDPDALPDLPLTRESVTAFLAESGSPLGKLPAAALDGMARVVALNNRFVRNHHHRRYNGPVLHFRAAKDHADEAMGLRPERWRPHVGSLDVYDIPVVHAQMTGAEAISHIATRLKAALLDHEMSAKTGHGL